MNNAFPHRGLYAIIDSRAHLSYGLVRLFTDIVTASTIPVVQLRLKILAPAAKLKLLADIATVRKQRDIKIIINDDVDFLPHDTIDGLHLGQDDLEDTKLPRTNKLIGISTHTADEVTAAEIKGATYIGCGAVFATQTKVNTTNLGIAGLTTLVALSKLPVVAIGGIDQTNIAEIAQSGAAMAAVISALIDNGKFVGQALHESFLKATS